MDRRQRHALRLNLLFGVIAATAGLAVRAQPSPDDLLPLSEAFRLELSRPEAVRVRVSWTIADGYYLYRHRFAFEAAPAGVRDGFSLPPGIVRQDPFFGETEIYRHRVEFELPLEKSAAGHDRIRLRIVSQGCADIGICFPPEARQAELAVGERAVPEAGDPFAPAGAGQPAELGIPASPQRSRPPPAGRSP